MLYGGEIFKNEEGVIDLKENSHSQPRLHPESLAPHSACLFCGSYRLSYPENLVLLKAESLCHILIADAGVDTRSHP